MYIVSPYAFPFMITLTLNSTITSLLRSDISKSEDSVLTELFVRDTAMILKSMCLAIPADPPCSEPPALYHGIKGWRR